MKTADNHFFGIGFWIGGGIFSIIHIIKIFTHARILNYDYIMIGVSVIFILLCQILILNKNKGDNSKLKDKYKIGLWFWIGGGIYNLINMIMILHNATRHDILIYNCLITGVAVIGLILNVILIKKERNK